MDEVPQHVSSMPVACRWLARYPIKEEEVMSALDAIPRADAIGGLENFIKQGLITFFKDPENMAKILEHLRIK